MCVIQQRSNSTCIWHSKVKLNTVYFFQRTTWQYVCVSHRCFFLVCLRINRLLLSIFLRFHSITIASSTRTSNSLPLLLYSLPQFGNWKIVWPFAVPLFVRISMCEGMALVSNLSAFFAPTYRSVQLCSSKEMS